MLFINFLKLFFNKNFSNFFIMFSGNSNSFFGDIESNAEYIETIWGHNTIKS